jgi:NAD(P)-dependent dehydrogenase (short-subunit alcohol dehydrogenase family)
MTKIIVITGAGEGLGKALARRFCQDGDRVVVLGRTLSKLEALAEELGEACMAVRCDVADPASVRDAFATIGKAHDRIHVLINNAAVYAPFELADAEDEQVMAQIGTNVAGPIFVAREALPLMVQGSHIINLTSESVDVPIPMMWLYAATKTAVERIGEGWRKELQPRGIRVTTVRAGKMYGEGRTGSGWDHEITMKFAKACAEAGMPMQEQPLSDFASLPDVFRMIVDAKPDLNLHHVSLGARRPG